MIMDWLTGKAQKDEQEKRKRDQENNRIQSEYFAKENELWRLVINTQTDRIASFDEFDDRSIEAIYSLLPYSAAFCLSRDNTWGHHQRLHVANPFGDNPEFYIACRYPHDDRGPYANICFGYYQEGFDIIKSRFNLVDNLLKNRQTSPQVQEKRKDLRALIQAIDKKTE